MVYGCRYLKCASETLISLMEKQAKVDEVLKLKADISVLVQNIRDQVTVSNKYSHENQYLQDYIGSVMKSGDMK